MSTYLKGILDSVRARLEEKRSSIPIEQLQEVALAAEPARDFEAAIRAPGISLIAEIKRSSPSAGEIRTAADAAEIAASYTRGGARAISVLTEPEFFAGSLEDLAEVRGACALPALRKDFLIDPYQVVESRAAGADAVLLIVAAIGNASLLRDLVTASSDSGMAVLVEVHDESELVKGLEAGAPVIGINQRDLATFEIDHGLARRMRRLVPTEIPVVAESGITSRSDVALLEQAGLDAILVGETLMRSTDPAEEVARLLGLDTG